MNPFTIGALARAAGVGVETVRFYERKGLLKRPSVAEGFRKYSEEDARRIRFIKRAQELGFTLRQIKGLLGLNASPRSTCADVKRQTGAKMQEVEQKIRDLRRMQRSLKALSEACGEGKQALTHCQILNCFEPGWKCE